MSNDNFKRSPIYTAQRLFGQGQGKESNPFAYETMDRKYFDAEIERLELAEMKRGAES